MAELTGQTFAGYEILAKLGQGGMGAVYKARQPMLNRLVALKMMAPNLSGDPAFVARFIREASAAANLNHPNMVQVYTAGENDKIYYIAMEFVEGESLRIRLDRLGRIPPQEAIAITVYVAQALQYAWNKARLIHRDIKPDNVFLSNAGEVKVGDLGLAKSVGGETTELTQTGTAMGSPHYISPEQATGLKDVDFRTDIYSLGCTLYHMLTGQTPYTGDSSMIVMMKHVNDPPPAIFKTWPACPMPLGMLVGKMLAKDRNARPQSYEQLLDDLMAVHEKLKNLESVRAVAVTPTAPQPKSATPPVQATVAARPSAKPKNLKAIYAAVGAAAVVALAGLMFWSPWKTGEGQSAKEQVVAPGSAGILPASSEPGSGTAGKMPALPVETAAAPTKSNSLPADTVVSREIAPAPTKFGTLFDGRDTSAWQRSDGGACDWRVEDGALVAGATDLDTREKFQDFELHIEFACPQDRKQGNSGVYIQGRYELQILESFGKPGNHVCCGAIFQIKAPIKNASKPPDEWQSFDITFHAARFDAAGAKTANARVSVIHNGRLIHDNAEIPKSTGKGDEESAAPGPIRLQGYGSPVRFRNISIKPLATTTAEVVNADGWSNLFDGKTLDGWRVLKGAAGGVEQAGAHVENGQIILDQGPKGAAVYSTRSFPSIDYEVEVEAMRLVGKSDFCTLDFPIGPAQCNWSVGSYGSTAGLELVDGKPPKENGTIRTIRFQQRQWYRFRLQVTGPKIEGWVDDQKVLDVATAGHKFTTPGGIAPAPGQFGIWSWQSQSAVRSVRMRSVKLGPLTATALKKTRRVLVFCRCEGFVHRDGIAAASKAIEEMGRKNGAFETDISSDYEALDAAKLVGYDAIVLNNTTKLKIPDEAKKQALLDFVRGGKGLVGIHAATDNFDEDPPLAKLIGGIFDGHPWGANGTWAIKPDEPAHPLCRAFEGKGFKLKDEIYQLKEPYTRADRRVLLSLDLSDPATANVRGMKREDKDFAVAWIKNEGKGRVFYCGLGHGANGFEEPTVLQFCLDGIRWALGDLEADATPVGAPVASATTATSTLPLLPVVALDPAALRYGLYFHFDITTFTGYQNMALVGKALPSVFAPKALDVRQWARVAREAGASFAVLTAKHEAGFCLWPAKDYDYHVGLSPVKTDIVGAFVAACKAEGIKAGVHYAVPDARTEGQVKFRGLVEPAHFAIIKKHLTELTANYPDIVIYIMDCAQRFSPEQLREVSDLLKQSNPQRLVLQTALNERQGRIPSIPGVQEHNAVSVNKNWFWAPNTQLIPASVLYQEYQKSAQQNLPLLVNVGPNRNGRIPDEYVAVLTELKGMMGK